MSTSNCNQKYIPNKDTILVIGTGLSINFTKNQYPQLSWVGLIKSGYKFALDRGLIDPDTHDNWVNILSETNDVDEVVLTAELLGKKLGAPEGANYTEWLRKSFNNIKPIDEDTQRIIKRISDSGVKICTLNYDTLLEDATSLPSICVSESKDVIAWIRGEKSAILHLHGIWDKPESCVLGVRDYEKTLNNEVRDFFQRSLASLNTLLFVGCGSTFEDANISNLSTWLKSKFNSSISNHFALVLNTDIKKRLKDPSWQNFVDPIGFGDSHSDLPDYLRDLFAHLYIEEKASLPQELLVGNMAQGLKPVDLNSIKCYLPNSPQALGIRHAQVFTASKFLDGNKYLWLTADWGMNEKEFLWSIIQRGQNISAEIFLINASSYTSRESFYEKIESLIGHSFESFCIALGSFDNSYLILDDIPFDADHDKSLALQNDLQDLTNILASYCENLKVILISRQSPPTKTSWVELAALDKADSRAYIEGHPNYKNNLSHDEILLLFEHTNGVPKLITDDLNKLAVASLSEVVAEEGHSISILAGRFHSAMLNLASSNQQELKYAFTLLKFISIFPNGEYLENLKRVDRTKKFAISHVTTLQQQGFIYVEEQDELAKSDNQNQRKRLIATRAVKDWIYSNTKQAEFSRIYSAAFKLYFGDQWESGTFKLHSSFISGDLVEKSAELSNAKFFLKKIFSDAENNSRKQKISMALASHFCAKAMEKSHYKVVHDLCTAITPMLSPENPDNSYWYLIYQYGRALRMFDGDEYYSRAIEKLKDALPHIQDNKTIANLNINMALAYKSLRNFDLAKEHAEKAAKISRGKALLSAKHIILTCSKHKNQSNELFELETKARKSNAHKVVSNIALSRSRRITDPEKKSELLQGIVDYSHKNLDFYNKARALIELGTTMLQLDKPLQEKTKSSLISIYHHLSDEKMDKLLVQCRSVLWKHFAVNKDLINLLQLFRYSSLRWRLRKESQEETEAIQELDSFVDKAQLEASGKSSSAISYYLGRVSGPSI